MEGGGRAWGCVNAMISADQAMLLLIGTVETLGCLPLHSNEKPWPPLVSKVTKAYCNCTFSNGVSHARTATPVMTITIMSPGSVGAFQSSVILGEGMLVSCCQRFKGCNSVFDYDTFTHWNLFLNHQVHQILYRPCTHMRAALKKKNQKYINLARKINGSHYV